MTVQDALAKVVGGEDLTRDEAQNVMSFLMLGEVHNGLVGGLLVGVQSKGVSGEELAGFARAIRKEALQFDFGIPDLVDTCGTGGGRSTFNMSTAAAILAAACGAKVAKHGNRAVTSLCGSADVLEALQVPIEGGFDEQRARLEKFGLVFLFAPSHHPAVRHVGPVRKALGIRTFFNLLGPLANPAGATRQLVGVFDRRSMTAMAEAMIDGGIEHAFVVHSRDGMDEISPLAETDYLEVKDGAVREGTWSPSDFGISGLAESALAPGESIQENAKILTESLSEVASPRCSVVVPNTAVTLVLSGVVESVDEGVELARARVADGTAARLLAGLAV
jgi:anthranilate phosphoribosyltransferase